VNRRTPEDDRTARLAAALRENLRRRKAQARGRREEGAKQGEPAEEQAEAGSGRS
jgi:hypothetical protein